MPCFGRKLRHAGSHRPADYGCSIMQRTRERPRMLRSRAQALTCCQARGRRRRRGAFHQSLKSHAPRTLPLPAQHTHPGTCHGARMPPLYPLLAMQLMGAPPAPRPRSGQQLRTAPAAPRPLLSPVQSPLLLPLPPSAPSQPARAAAPGAWPLCRDAPRRRVRWAPGVSLGSHQSPRPAHGAASELSLQT